MMTIEDLVSQGSVHRFDASREEIVKVMDIARRDLGVAENVLDESMDWSYTIAYNAVLQACKSLHLPSRIPTGQHRGPQGDFPIHAIGRGRAVQGINRLL